MNDIMLFIRFDAWKMLFAIFHVEIEAKVASKVQTQCGHQADSPFFLLFP